MPHGSRPGSRPARRRPWAVLGLAAALLALLAGCAGATFDPTGPCKSDGSASGAYPDLEAQVPKVFRGSAPSVLDSGRTCSAEGLGTLTAHGVRELRFAGSTWETGSQSGLSLAVLTSPDGSALPADWLAEFYESGAKTGKNVEKVVPTDFEIQPGVPAHRIDVLNGESYQTVIVWPKGGLVAAVLVADFIREIQTKDAHDKVVQEAIAAWGTANVPVPAEVPPVVPLTPAPSA
jgi:hypothetical protein